MIYSPIANGAGYGNSEDQTWERSYKIKWKKLISEYEEIKERGPVRYKFIREFFKVYGISRQLFKKYEDYIKNYEELRPWSDTIRDFSPSDNITINKIMTDGNPLHISKLNWLYIDINSYFATIEQQIDLDLRNKPIVVVPVLTDTTCAIAASLEAKRRGIKTGTKIYEAKKLCPELICIIAKHEIYVEYHKKIFAEVNKHVCVDHIFSIDEAACRLTGNQCAEQEAVKLAAQIKRVIKKNVGEYINCSIGIAPNRYLAKIATNMQKPDGLVVIKPTDIPKKLYSLGLLDLPGIGSSTYNKLLAAGIQNVEQLYTVDAPKLRRIWGSIWGEKIWSLLRGVDLPLEKTKNSTIGHSQVLAPKLRDLSNARMIALHLLLKTAKRLRDKKLYASTIMLSLSAEDGQIIQERIKVGNISDSSILSRALLKHWDESTKINKIRSFKKVAISLTNLEEKSNQLSFNDFLNNQNGKSKKDSLSRVIDKLNDKYGQNVVTLGLLSGRDHKESIVAFKYIPEE